MALKSYLFSALAYATAVAAHGHVTEIVVNGKSFIGFDSTSGKGSNEYGWKTLQDKNDYVPSPQEKDQNTFDNGIACHKGAEPATSAIEIAAGDTVTLKWDKFDDTHDGPVIDYLAKCDGECSSAKASDLKFFKFQEDGFDGKNWGTDKVSSTFSWDTTIPADIAPGNYVLRHELIALQTTNQPQFYPQCVNLKVTGSGSANPEGVVASSFYNPQKDLGLTFNLYNNTPTYIIPGPKLYQGGGGSGSAPGGGNSTAPVSSSMSAPSGTSSGFTTMTRTTETAGGPSGGSDGNSGSDGSSGDSGNLGNSGSSGSSGSSSGSSGSSGSGSGSCNGQ